MEKKTALQHGPVRRVIAFLNRVQVDFLDRLGKDALFSTGIKLSRVKIISCLVDLIMEIGISAKGISGVADFKQRIKEKFSQTGKNVDLTPRKIIVADKNIAKQQTEEQGNG